MTAPGYPVLWIDPGKMTGLALWRPKYPDKLWADEFDFMAAGDHIEFAVRDFGPDLRIGWEHFHVHARTPGDDAYYAIEMIGVARRIAYRSKLITFKPAQPAQRDIATMAMLKHIGWWVPGKDDAQSAAQHLLAWMERSNMTPPQIEVKLAQFRMEVADGNIG